MARFGDLEITVAEVDARILALPPSKRPAPGEDLDSWYESQIRELVVEHWLREQATADHLASDPSFVTSETEARKQLTVQLCLAKLRPEITETELTAAYEAAADQLAAPERRDVYTIFLRHGTGRPPASAHAEADALRARVLGGESFLKLAADHSDSESRHRQGSIGWVRPGQLADVFEAVIFSLDEGVPSAPVVAGGGTHLFYVDQILPARRPSLEEARPMLRDHLLAERQHAALAELETEVEPPQGSVLLDRAGLEALAEAGDPESAVLRLGETELTLGELRRMARQATLRRQAGTPALALPDLMWQQLERLRQRELLYSRCQGSGDVDADELEVRLDAWRQQAPLSLERQRRLAAMAGQDEDRLRGFYEGNIGFFSRPPRWHLRRLRIALDSSAPRVMARLEEAAASGSASLDRLQDELGGEIEDLGVKSLAQLRLVEPKLPALVAPLAVGELSPPYLGSDHLELVEVKAREEAEPLPFDEVRERVVSAYMIQYRSDLYEALTDEVLQGGELEILPEGLAALREAGVPQAEITVEQLEELLDRT